jgi:hypothetical protein
MIALPRRHNGQFGSRTTKNILLIGPLTGSEKQTNQNGNGVVRNSLVSGAHALLLHDIQGDFVRK